MTLFNAPLTISYINKYCMYTKKIWGCCFSSLQFFSSFFLGVGVIYADQKTALKDVHDSRDIAGVGGLIHIRNNKKTHSVN